MQNTLQGESCLIIIDIYLPLALKVWINIFLLIRFESRWGSQRRLAHRAANSCSWNLTFNKDSKILKATERSERFIWVETKYVVSVHFNTDATKKIQLKNFEELI